MATNRLKINDLLSQIFIFKDLSSEEIGYIGNKCSVQRLTRGGLLFTQGQPATAFFIVVFGRLSIYRVNKQGHEQVIHYHSDHDIVAEAAIFDLNIYPATCKATKEATVIRVPKTEFVEILRANSSIAIKILASYSRRLREFVSMVEYLSLDDIRLRVLKFLQKNYRIEGDLPVVTLTNTKKELALLLGTTPETLSRTLKKLKDEKIILEQKGKLVIRDLGYLKKCMD
jgi:CRP/FNR family transcriptional regulator, dissimilatory nitrate respiration regulator